MKIDTKDLVLVDYYSLNKFVLDKQHVITMIIYINHLHRRQIWYAS